MLYSQRERSEKITCKKWELRNCYNWPCCNPVAHLANTLALHLPNETNISQKVQFWDWKQTLSVSSLRCNFGHFFSTRWWAFVVKSASLTKDDHSKLQVTKAIRLRFSVQHCILLCDQVHLATYQQPPTTTSQPVRE